MMASMVSLLLLGTIRVSTDFEGGSVGRVEPVSADHLRCAVAGQADHEGRNRQASWYYFRLDDVPTDREIQIDLVNLVGEYNYKPGTHAVTRETRPVVSADQRVWHHLGDDQVTWDEERKELRLRFRPESETLWIAHVPPYTGSDLKRLSDDLGEHPALVRASVGRTLSGREIPLWTITDRETSDLGKSVVWCMARQHAWEAGSSWVAEGLVRFLLSDSPEAVQIRERVIFKILLMADPDGVASGAVRFNGKGHDLNRNWDAVDPESMPEIDAERRAMWEWLDQGRRIDLFLTIHNTESVDYLEGPIHEGGPAVRAIADRLHEALSRSPGFDSPGGPRDLRPLEAQGRKGRMTVHEALARERGVAAFLVELRIESGPKLGRCATVDDRLELGASLGRALANSVLARESGRL